MNEKICINLLTFAATQRGVKFVDFFAVLG